MDVPLTPIVVDVVTFDRAPLGRRGYHEDQVDDFLDRVQATLAGKDNLTAEDVRKVEFDPAPFIRRGYHEDQVDEFLDLVVEELTRREGGGAAPGLPTTGATLDPGGLAVTVPSTGSPTTANPVPTGSPATGTARPSTPPSGNPAIPTSTPAPASGPATVATPTPPPGSGHPAPVVTDPSTPVAWMPFPSVPRHVPPPTPTEQTNPMLFAQPPSWPSPSTQPLIRGASGPPNPRVAATTGETGAPEPSETGKASVAAGQAAAGRSTARRGGTG